MKPATLRLVLGPKVSPSWQQRRLDRARGSIGSHYVNETERGARRLARAKQVSRLRRLQLVGLSTRPLRSDSGGRIIDRDINMEPGNNYNEPDEKEEEEEAILRIQIRQIPHNAHKSLNANFARTLGEESSKVLLA